VGTGGCITYGEQLPSRQRPAFFVIATRENFYEKNKIT
jgi:hypothetical protein